MRKGEGQTPRAPEEERTITDDIRAACASATETLDTLLGAAVASLDGCDGDSYATRSDIAERIAGLHRIKERIARAAGTGSADFSVTVVDHGWDAEAAASDASCGIEHVPEAELRRQAHDALMGTLRHRGVITALGAAGITVDTSFRTEEGTQQDYYEGDA